MIRKINYVKYDNTTYGVICGLVTVGSVTRTKNGWVAAQHPRFPVSFHTPTPHKSRADATYHLIESYRAYHATVLQMPDAMEILTRYHMATRV